VKVWIARSHSGTHFRLQLEDEPFTAPWTGWDLRASTMSREDYDRLCRSTDEVEIERLHQECWRRAVTRGRPLAFGLLPAADPQDLR
jgi:hypothetical protein